MWVFTGTPGIFRRDNVDIDKGNAGYSGFIAPTGTA
jgi:hypothetical protein